MNNLNPQIYSIRNQRVMIDADLADLYSVDTKTLNRAVRRNLVRFPEDFMFQLNEKEDEFLRYQIGTSKKVEDGRGGRRYLPLVFTEQGVAMLSSVLRSEKAALINIEIMRAFVRLREMLLSNQGLSKKLTDLEKKYDMQFRSVFDTIRDLMKPVDNPKRRIGIINDED